MTRHAPTPTYTYMVGVWRAKPNFANQLKLISKGSHLTEIAIFNLHKNLVGRHHVRYSLGRGYSDLIRQRLQVILHHG